MLYMVAKNRPIFAPSFLFHFNATGNGSMPPFANNAPPGAPRDASFGGMGRPNGRAPGNGAPQVTIAGPPAASKSSVTISNGRDPRRAKRWNWGSGMSLFLSALSPLLQVPHHSQCSVFKLNLVTCIIFFFHMTTCKSFMRSAVSNMLVDYVACQQFFGL